MKPLDIGSIVHSLVTDTDKWPWNVRVSAPDTVRSW